MTTRRHDDSSQPGALQPQYPDLFEANPHPMWYFDAETLRFLAVNDAAVRHYGYGRDEFLAMTVADIRPPGDVPFLRETMERVATNPSIDLVGARHRKKDGTLIDVEITSHPVAFGGRPARLVMAFDTTGRVHAEEVAREASQLGAQVIRGAREGVIVHGPDLRYQVWNPFMEQLSGIPASEVVGTHPLESFPFLRDMGVVDRLECALRGGSPESVDFEFRFPRSGKSGWLSDTSAPLRNSKGEIVGVITTLSDITDRKLAAEKLVTRTRFIESLIDKSPIGFAGARMGDQVPVFISSNYERIFGVAPGSVKSISDIIDAVIPDPVACEAMKDRVVADMASGDPARMRWEKVAITTVTGESRFITVINVPLPDQNLMISTVQDVTEQARAEAALRESEKALRDAQHLARVGSWRWTPATDTVRWSAELCDILRYDPSLPAPSFANMSSYYTAESWQRLTATVAKTLETGEPYGLDLDVVCADGTIRSTHTRGTVARDANGGIAALHGTVHDITERKQAELALRRLQQAVDTSGEAIFITDVKGTIMYVNPAFTALYGFTAEEVVGRTTPRILKSGLLEPAAYAAFWRNLGGGQEVRGELLNRRKDGTIIAVESSASAILDESKRIAGFLGIQRDVSYRKEAEQALRASEARYRAVAQSAHDAIVTVDPAGLIVSWNGGAETIFGYTETEAVGQPLAILIPIRHQEAHRTGFKRVVGGGERHVIGASVELEGVRKDGTEFPLELSLAMWESAEGIFVTGILRDITARVREQAALRLQSAALNAAANPMVITDRDGTIEWVNEAFTTVTGYSPGEAIGHGLRVLLDSGVHDDAFHAHVWETVLTGAAWRGEMTSRRKDGSWYPEDVTMTPVKDTGGNVSHCIAIKRDLTEEKARHAQFLQSQKMESVGRLAGGIAHDFNNLLTVINNTADMASDNVREDDPIRADLEEIHRAGERAAALTAQLLSFSRKQIVKAEVVNLGTLVDDMRPMLERLIGEDLQLVVSPTHGVGSVRADTGQLEQVVMNLVINARDAMPTGGVLMIETRDVDLDAAFAAAHPPLRPGKHVVLVVRDRGIGMDEATRLRIFEPFFTTKGQGQGTGLGLATVYGIVEQSGGNITVESEPGQGTTFSIYLPRVEGDAPAARLARTRKAIRGSETILIVEDDTALLRMSTRILRSAGYKVLMAAEGAEALRVLEYHDGPVDLLLTDVVMPGMGGRELAGWLADIRPEIKILYTSGYTDDAILRHGVLERTAHFISKPYKRADLTKKVRSVLDGPPNRPAKV